jgi:hypothetical protein
LAAALTQDELHLLFTIKSDEGAWARIVARRGPSMVALLTHLKVFQTSGDSFPLGILRPPIAHIAKQIYLDAPAEFGNERRSLYRYHHAIRQYLGITPWGPKVRAIAATAIAAAAQAEHRY